MVLNRTTGEGSRSVPHLALHLLGPPRLELNEVSLRFDFQILRGLNLEPEGLFNCTLHFVGVAQLIVSRTYTLLLPEIRRIKSSPFNVSGGNQLKFAFVGCPTALCCGKIK